MNIPLTWRDSLNRIYSGRVEDEKMEGGAEEDEACFMGVVMESNEEREEGGTPTD